MLSCIDVSHADVTITLIGENKLLCNVGESFNTSKDIGAMKRAGLCLQKETQRCFIPERSAALSVMWEMKRKYGE